MPAPLVSVIITAKDYARFLPEAIESVLNQSIGIERIDLIVVDDGSVDETAEVARRYAGTVHYIYQENRGQAGALNTAFRAAQGEFVALLDADDYFYKTKLEEVIAKFKEDPMIGMVCHRLDVVENSGKVIHSAPFKMRLSEGWLREQIIRYGGSCYAFATVSTSGLAFRRRDLELIFPIPEDMFRLCADGYLVTQIPLYRHVGAIHKSLSVFRRHGNSYWSTQELTAEIIQNRFVIPMANISELVRQRLPEQAKFIDVRNDFKYMEYYCLLNKLKGRLGSMFWDYILFIRAILRDSRIRCSYKIWRLLSVAFMLLVPYCINSRVKSWYSKNSLFYRLRTKVFPDARSGE